MAAEANRPTNSLVSRFSATEAARVPSYLPTAATTGRSDNRRAAASRSSSRVSPSGPGPYTEVPSRASAAAASRSASTRRSIRPEITPSSTSCTE